MMDEDGIQQRNRIIYSIKNRIIHSISSVARSHRQVGRLQKKQASNWFGISVDVGAQSTKATGHSQTSLSSSPYRIVQYHVFSFLTFHCNSLTL